MNYDNNGYARKSNNEISKIADPDTTGYIFNPELKGKMKHNHIVGFRKRVLTNIEVDSQDVPLNQLLSSTNIIFEKNDKKAKINTDKIL